MDTKSYLPVSTLTEILPPETRTKTLSAGYYHHNSLFPMINVLTTPMFASDHPAPWVHRCSLSPFNHKPSHLKIGCSPVSHNCYAKFCLISSFNFPHDNLFVSRVMNFYASGPLNMLFPLLETHLHLFIWLAPITPSVIRMHGHQLKPYPKPRWGSPCCMGPEALVLFLLQYLFHFI